MRGEPADTQDAEEARRWVRAYYAIVAALEPKPGAAAARAAFWARRLLELHAVELDLEERTLSWAGRSTALSSRELQLMSFLRQHPDRLFGADDLVSRAWNNPDLSPDQVRGYIRRLRRKLRTLEAPYELVTVAGRGYSLRWRRNGGG